MWMYGLSDFKSWILRTYWEHSTSELNIENIWVFNLMSPSSPSYLVLWKEMLSVTISCLFFLERIPWFCPLLSKVSGYPKVCGFSFFCCSKTFLNTVSLPQIHLTYRNSQTNLFKAYLSAFYPHAQAFPVVLPLSSNLKFLSPITESLWNQDLSSTKSSLLPQHKPTIMSAISLGSLWATACIAKPKSRLCTM